MPEQGQKLSFVSRWAIMIFIFISIGNSSCRKESFVKTGGVPITPAVECVPVPTDGTADPAIEPVLGEIAFMENNLHLHVVGGIAPMSFKVLQGGGEVSSAGVFRATGSGTNIVQVRDAACRKATVSILVADPGVSSKSPNDASYPQQWAHATMRSEKAWGLNTDCRSVPVGIIDSGMDMTHPDLAANLWTNSGEIAGNGIDDDGNGYIDDVHGWNFVRPDGAGPGDNDPTDLNHHGTHVAGIIGASGNNSIGVAGVCWKASLVPLRFIDANGSGTTSHAIEAINYARVAHLKILNNSWGGGGYSQTLKDTMDAAGSEGIIFVAAAGNSGTNNDIQPMYPANYASPNSIAVAASGANDQLTSFSNFGAGSVHLAAPGLSILSTLPTAITYEMGLYGLPTDYGSESGTSMATPYVVGAAALLWSFDPLLSAGEVKDRIMNTVLQSGGYSGRVISQGRLDLARVLNPGY